MFAVYRFYTEYGQNVETTSHLNPVTGHHDAIRRVIPGQREIHMVEYGPLGSDKTKVCSPVSFLRPKLQPGMEPQPGSAEEQAMVKWGIIEPLYLKWLKGQEITPDGTPLAAWAGVGREQAEGLKRREIYTVEQLAQLTDTHIMQYGIQGLRNLRDNARRFVSTLDKSTVTAALEQKDMEIDGLREQLAALTDLVRGLQSASVQTQAPQAPAADDSTDPGNDDAFGGPDGSTDDLVPVTTPPRQARRR